MFSSTVRSSIFVSSLAHSISSSLKDLNILIGNFYDEMNIEGHDVISSLVPTDFKSQ